MDEKWKERFNYYTGVLLVSRSEKEHACRMLDKLYFDTQRLKPSGDDTVLPMPEAESNSP